ncbi:MAG: hypothetical protein QOJ63_2963, partial [Solirubrobacteraceae bacterium]|nr:hypothetical protein [Solirubrobacteraceae bacterium]
MTTPCDERAAAVAFALAARSTPGGASLGIGSIPEMAVTKDDDVAFRWRPTRNARS